MWRPSSPTLSRTLSTKATTSWWRTASISSMRARSNDARALYLGELLHGDLPEPGAGLDREQLDLEPAVELGALGEDLGHLGAAVARDHGGILGRSQTCGPALHLTPAPNGGKRTRCAPTHEKPWVEVHGLHLAPQRCPARASMALIASLCSAAAAWWEPAIEVSPSFPRVVRGPSRCRVTPLRRAWS